MKPWNWIQAVCSRLFWTASPFVVPWKLTRDLTEVIYLLGKHFLTVIFHTIGKMFKIHSFISSTSICWMPTLYQTYLVPGNTVVNNSDLASTLIKYAIYISLLVMLSTQPAKSSRLLCTVVQGAHCTMKPKRWGEWGLKSTSHSPHQCCALAFSWIWLSKKTSFL